MSKTATGSAKPEMRRTPSATNFADGGMTLLPIANHVRWCVGAGARPAIVRRVTRRRHRVISASTGAIASAQIWYPFALRCSRSGMISRVSSPSGLRYWSQISR